MNSLRLAGKHLLAMLMIATFSIYIGVGLLLMMANSPAIYGSWLSVFSGDDIEAVDQLLAKSEPIAISESAEPLVAPFPKDFHIKLKPSQHYFLNSPNVERYFFPSPQICSNTGIFLCLRL
ncbi:MAG TPA: hypothetical protein PLV65_04355 [Tenuifilaceae bacterium]|nr:hypothetical protein [Tenuifilaceae bacterium]